MDRLKHQYVALNSTLDAGRRASRDGPEVSKFESDNEQFLQRGFGRSRSPIPLRKRRLTLLLICIGLVFLLFVSATVFQGGQSTRSPTIQESYVPVENNYIHRAFGSDPAFISPVSREKLAQLLSRVALYNVYDKPATHRTPMFIAFTRNNALLEQTVLSYIAAGWPPDEIVVVDNSGTMNANQRKLLSEDNPFFLNYERLTENFGVSVLRTPTLLSFAQLQNFFIAQALDHDWDYYFWSHMDIVVVSDETAQPYKSAYQRLVEDMTRHMKKWERTRRSPEKDEGEYIPGTPYRDWALRFYAYDWLTLVNTRAMERVGAYDVFIPYYTTDCDFQDRVRMSGLEISDGSIGRMYDVASSLSNVESALFPGKDEDRLTPNSTRYHEVGEKLKKMEKHKKDNDRNIWQDVATGGKGEPWTYNPKGFQKAWWIWDGYGRQVYKQKWKLTDYNGRCMSLIQLGKKLDYAWG